MGGRTPDGSGWKPPGAGRKPGTKNKRTVELEKIIAEQEAKLAELTGQPVKVTAHEVLVQIYQNANLPWAVRAQAARDAIRFEKPALSSEDRTIKGEVGVYKAIPVFERDAITLTTVAGELTDG